MAYFGSMPIISKKSKPKLAYWQNNVYFIKYFDISSFKHLKKLISLTIHFKVVKTVK